MKLFLVGFMGCGKTTFGKRLAKKLNFPFIDLDKVIEASTGMPIPEYFKKFGENAFREKENEIIKHTSFPSQAIIATGGGAPCFFDNMDWMNANGTTVYIALTAKALASRLEHANEDRPVLQGKKGEELEKFIADKLAEREPFYNMAALKVEGLNISPESFLPILENYQRK